MFNEAEESPALAVGGVDRTVVLVVVIVVLKLLFGRTERSGRKVMNFNQMHSHTSSAVIPKSPQSRAYGGSPGCDAL